jgi:hypothetical protein
MIKKTITRIQALEPFNAPLSGVDAFELSARDASSTKSTITKIHAPRQSKH